MKIRENTTAWGYTLNTYKCPNYIYLQFVKENPRAQKPPRLNMVTCGDEMNHTVDRGNGVLLFVNHM